VAYNTNFGKTNRLRKLLERSLQERSENETAVMEKLHQLTKAIDTVCQGKQTEQSIEMNDKPFPEKDMGKRLADAGLSKVDTKSLII